MKEHLEAVNHAEAFTYIQELSARKNCNEISFSDVLDIHRLILKKIDDTNAGKLRNIAVRIAGSTTILPNPLKVPELLGEFIQWLQTTDEPTLKIAADAHFKLVTIHPFVDGNGRTARLLMNLILMQGGFPPAVIRKEERNRYLTSLEIGQTKGNLGAYYELVFESINRSLDIYLETMKPQESSKFAQALYTTDEVAKILQVDPESVRRYVRSGKLKAVKLSGKFIRIEKKDLDSFINKHKS